jgi:hypothetical protein
VGLLGAAAAQERISAALDAIDAAHDVLRDTSSDLVGIDFRVKVAERLETQERVNRGLMYRFFAEIADPPDGTGFLPMVRDVLWARLHITPQEITRRFRLACDHGAASRGERRTEVTESGRLGWSDGTGPPEIKPRPPPR